MVKRGELWFVNLDPTIGHEIKKSRPAIIIQNNTGNKYSPTTIIAPVSSKNVQKVYPIEVLLTKKCGLDNDSKALLNQIRTIDKSRLVKRLGKVDEAALSQIDTAIKISLGLVKT